MASSPGLLSVEEALERVLAAVAPLGHERVPIGGARGRVLAESLVSERTLPPWDNSAMDGYAVRSAEVALGQPLPVAATIAAGHAPSALGPGTVARIMTGAPMPDGADAVIMREDSDEKDGLVRFTRVPQARAHVRRAGEDVAPGLTVLPTGTTLGAGEIGLAAALGRTLVTVHRRPRVAIVSTGDELVEPDRPPAAGQIVGSNAYALAAQCEEAGANVTLLPIARDDRDVIRASLAEAVEADAVISSGGVSVGEFDYVKDALADLGVAQQFWQVRMKPGKPLTFGTHGRRPVFGLPGNPASSMVGFELFVRPALLRMQGHTLVERPRAEVLLEDAWTGPVGRRHFLRGVVRREGGVLLARPHARQGSGMLHSMVGYNALIEIPEGTATLAVGATVRALLLQAV